MPGLEAGDLAALTDRGAVGLLVPDAGPRTSGARARAALERGAVRNSVLGGLPEGEARLDVETAGAVPSGPAIVLGLPTGGEQPNKRRYPIAVLGEGYRGVLTSDSTRIPGLVSIVDVAPTALGEEGALGSSADDDPLGTLKDLDERIEANRDAKTVVLLLSLALIVAVATFFPAGVLPAFRRRAPGEPRARRDRADRVLDRRAGPGLHHRRRPASGARGTGRPRIPHGRRARRFWWQWRSTSAGSPSRRSARRRTRASMGSRTCWRPCSWSGVGRRRPALAPVRDLGVRRSGGAFARDGRRKLRWERTAAAHSSSRRLSSSSRRSSSASTGDWRSGGRRDRRRAGRGTRRRRLEPRDGRSRMAPSGWRKTSAAASRFSWDGRPPAGSLRSRSSAGWRHSSPRPARRRPLLSRSWPHSPFR